MSKSHTRIKLLRFNREWSQSFMDDRVHSLLFLHNEFINMNNLILIVARPIYLFPLRSERVCVNIYRNGPCPANCLLTINRTKTENDEKWIKMSRFLSRNYFESAIVQKKSNGMQLAVHLKSKSLQHHATISRCNLLFANHVPVLFQLFLQCARHELKFNYQDHSNAMFSLKTFHCVHLHTKQPPSSSNATKMGNVSSWRWHRKHILNCRMKSDNYYWNGSSINRRHSVMYTSFPE